MLAYVDFGVYVNMMVLSYFILEPAFFFQNARHNAKNVIFVQFQ